MQLKSATRQEISRASGKREPPIENDSHGVVPSGSLRVSPSGAKSGMRTPSAHEITQLLRAWSGGDSQALEKLTPLVYEKLHYTAQRYMAQERPSHTLQTTALINEVYVRLVDFGKVSWHDRAHFFAVSARLMRRILTDFARSRHYQKRGG